MGEAPRQSQVILCFRDVRSVCLIGLKEARSFDSIWDCIYLLAKLATIYKAHSPSRIPRQKM